jgi:acyl homoserine lactone synthase
MRPKDREVAQMAMVAMGSCWQLSSQILTLMHAFRHEIFVKRLKWSLPLVNGVERDQYDTAEAKYVVVTDGPDRVTACARLLPTTAAYMLPDLFPQLLGGASVPRDAAVWELSRFATSVRETREGRVLSLSKPTLEFLDLIFGFARRHDIARLVFVTSIKIERLMLRAGMPVHRIAPPALVDGHLSVALFIEITQETPLVSPAASVPSDQARRSELAGVTAALAMSLRGAAVEQYHEQ